SLLDRIRSDARRDAAEFGFEQLRLAIVFLRWADPKDSPPERFDSPLVLLPVRLAEMTRVRDSYWLQPLSTEAQVNPVMRDLFRPRVRGSPTLLRQMVEEKPSPRSYLLEAAEAEPAEARRERQFYEIRLEADDNPYHWDFDLCRLTLGNFRYRKMTLVRDYA